MWGGGMEKFEKFDIERTFLVVIDQMKHYNCRNEIPLSTAALAV